MTPFEAALAKGNAATRATNGEPLRLTPMVPGRYKSGTVDTSRAIRVVVGIFLEGPGRTKVADNEMGRELNSGYIVQPTVAIVHGSELLVGGSIVKPKNNDRLSRDDHPASGDYEIQSVEPNGGDGFALRLVRVIP